MDELKEKYLRHFPKKYCKDIIDYANNIFPDYLFVRKEGKKKIAYCTSCRKEFSGKNLKHKEKVECPKCKKVVFVQLDSYSRTRLYNEIFFIHYEKSAIDPNVIIARGINGYEDYSIENFKVVKPVLLDQSKYVFEINNAAMLTRAYYYIIVGRNNFHISKSIYSDIPHYWQRHRVLTAICVDSIAKAIEGTNFKYSQWNKYTHINDSSMINFFDLYCKYPLVVEYLTKLGFHKLIEDKLMGCKTYNTINWKGKTIFKMLRLTKLELKQITSSSLIITSQYIRLFQINKASKEQMNIYELKEVENAFGSNGTNQMQELQRLAKYFSLKKLFNYIKKQYAECKDRNGKCYFYSIGDTLTNYKDYIKDCKKLEFDLSKKSVFLPRNLYRAHQNTIKQVKYNEAEHLNAKFKERIKSLKKFYFEYNGLITLAPESSKELINEGSKLNHCVGGYADRHAKGETTILFIRKKDKIHIPYYTVEINQNSIIQVRGKNNCRPTENVEEFISKFEAKVFKKKSSKRVGIPA